jgi:Tfp pilus assembly protein FimT
MRLSIRNGRKADGFSIVEIVAVLAIILSIGAFAIPYFIVSAANIRLRGGMSSLSGLIQNCRMQAIKNNTNKSVHFTIVSHGPVAFIVDATASTTLDPNNPSQAQLGAPVSLVRTLGGTGAPTAIDNSIFNGLDPLTSDLSFTPRGLPCQYATSTGTCTTGKAFVYYFTDIRPLGASGWAAVTVTPAGRVKTWYWSGSAWGD